MSLEGRIVGIVEDDRLMGESLMQSLSLEGAHVAWWQTGAQALAALETMRADVVLCDIRLEDTDGIALYGEAKKRGATSPFIFMTAYGNIDQAVKLMRAGAEDYITKPFELSDLLRRIDTALPDGPGSQAAHCLGVSEAMKRVQKALATYANAPKPLLITGEVGVGKEYCARYLHQLINRGEGPFISVNCALIPPELLVQRLFDSSAQSGEASYFERAEGGILFIDGVTRLPGDLQARLAHIIEAEVAGTTAENGRGRAREGPLIIATARRDLNDLVARGDFREDLRNLFDPTHLNLPALRERPQDIVWHLDRCLKDFKAITVSNIRGLNTAAEAEALQHDWPRNVAELRRRMERAMALALEEWITPLDLFPERGFGGWQGQPNVTSLAEARAEAERRQIERALALHDGQLTKAAKTLGISRTTLWEKIKRLGLVR